MKKVSYFRLECELIKQRMTKNSTTAIAKIGKNEDVSLKALRIIASVLKCNIQDLIVFEDEK